MPVSQRFRELRTAVRQLRNHFLPKQFDPTGTYSERQFDRARAFRLLVHAEIEWYLEEIAFETANKAFDDWQKHGRVTLPLLAMVSFIDARHGKVPQTGTISPSPDLDYRIETSKNRFNAYAKGRNNGIREEDILRLLLPVGVRESDLDRTWLSTTNSFGQSRGKAAHMSKQVYNAPDPKSEFEIVNQILAGLLDIDVKLLKLRAG